MPQRLDQRAATAAEHKYVARKWITAQCLLHHTRQAVHAAAHIGVAGRDPDAHCAGDRDHRNACKAAAANAAEQCEPIFNLVPLANSTMIAVVSGIGAAAGSVASTAGANAAT